MSRVVKRDNEIRDAVKSCTKHFAFAAVYSLVANLLMLAFPLFMLNAYNRVLTSRSLSTLAVLFVGFAIAILFEGIFRWLRSALLVRASVRLDRRLTERVLQALFERRAAGKVDIGPQALRDLDQFRSFVTGSGGTAMIEAPMGGLFLGALFILNVPMAITAVIAILIITGLTIADAMLTKNAIAKADRETLSSYGFVEMNLPTAEAVVGMGMMRGVLQKWQGVRDPALAAQLSAANRSNGFDEAITVVRYISQGVLISVGVIEVIAGSTNAGLLIAGLFIFNFAMNPFNRIVGAWSHYPPVKQGLERLEKVLQGVPELPSERLRHPRPAGELAVRNLYYVPPGQDRAIVRNISFGLKPGTTLGVVGLIGSGKTTLARLIVGAFKPTSGSVRLEGNEVFDWIRGDGGRYLGYVPQSVALQTATVAENIGRFGMFDDGEILEAARLAGAHEIIQKLPLGYDTVIGEGGHPISGGQRQLIALARAVVGLPPLVVLDEPNSNLDGPGEDSLMKCLDRLKEIGSTVILVSHRPQLVRQLDKLLLIKEGQMVAFGDSGDVWKDLGRPVVVKRGAGAFIDGVAADEAATGLGAVTGRVIPAVTASVSGSQASAATATAATANPTAREASADAAESH